MTYNMIMDKKLHLTQTIGPVSAKVLQKLIGQGKTIFTLDEACEVYAHSRQETTDLLRDLVNRGVLARIKSGVFMTLQMGQEQSQLTNWPLIARLLIGDNDYYLSHYSAMRLHGMTTHPVMDVLITTSRRIKSKKIQNFVYRFIYTKPEHCWGKVELWVTKQEKVYVSDLERTLLDGLDRSDLCGGIKEIIRGIWVKQQKFDWHKLVFYAKRYHSRAAVKRLGFILEKLNVGEDYLPSLEKTILSAKDYILLDPDGSKSGKYYSRWRIQININRDELKESVWG